MEGEVDEGGGSHKMGAAINGNTGWARKGDRIEDAPEQEFSIIKNAQYALRMVQVLPEFKDPAFKLSLLGEGNVNGKPAVGIAIVHKDYKDASLYFDKETGLPAKSEIRLTIPNGKEITMETFYSDFQESGGIKHPMKITFKADNMEFVTEVSEIKFKEKVEDSEFAKP